MRELWDVHNYRVIMHCVGDLSTTFVLPLYSFRQGFFSLFWLSWFFHWLIFNCNFPCNSSIFTWLTLAHPLGLKTMTNLYRRYAEKVLIDWTILIWLIYPYCLWKPIEPMPMSSAPGVTQTLTAWPAGMFQSNAMLISTRTYCEWKYVLTYLTK